MSNEGGINQFQGFGIDPPYGDVKKQMELTKEAPISGAPISGHALGTPDRIRQQRQGGPQRRGTAPMGGPTLPQLPIPYEQQIAMIWQQAASAPGASELVKHYAEVSSTSLR